MDYVLSQSAVKRKSRPGEKFMRASLLFPYLNKNSLLTISVSFLSSRQVCKRFGYENCAILLQATCILKIKSLDYFPNKKRSFRCDEHSAKCYTFVKLLSLTNINSSKSDMSKSNRLVRGWRLGRGRKKKRREITVFITGKNFLPSKLYLKYKSAGLRKKNV